MLDDVKKIYWRWLHRPAVHKVLRYLFDGIVNVIARLKGWHFPPSYLRQWKVDMIFGGYERGTTRLYKKIIRPGMSVVDVGAHIGYYTRLFSRLVGPSGMVLAIEADPTNFSLLQKNTAHLSNVRLMPKALGDHQGSVTLYESLEKSGCHSTILGATERQQAITVACADLDSLVMDQGIKKIDLIKMDIEGGEPTALRGMKRVLAENPQLLIVTEVSQRCLTAAGVTVVDYLRQLQALGFNLYEVGEHDLTPVVVEPFSPQRLFARSDFINLFCRRS